MTLKDIPISISYKSVGEESFSKVLNPMLECSKIYKRSVGFFSSSALDFIGEMLSLGIDTIICTDISKDGALSGTNTDLYKLILSKYELNLIASGGVTSLDDIVRLRDIGCYGAITGKAIYNGNIDLKEAILLGEGRG